MPGCNTLWCLFLFVLVDEDTCTAGACQSDFAFFALRMILLSEEGTTGGVATTGGRFTAADTVAFVPVIF
jgi:hypothetical protein